MDYTLYQLLWFFLIYAFLGWLMETALAAVRKRRLLNRGFLNAPFSPVYGLAAVLFAIFLPELRSAPFFLFLGGMILATGLELSTGLLLERISHQKWWDYSDEPWNFNGHICLKYSLVWGLLALLCVFFLNPLLVTLTGLLPRSVGKWLSLIHIWHQHPQPGGLRPRPQQRPQLDPEQLRLCEGGPEPPAAQKGVPLLGQGQPGDPLVPARIQGPDHHLAPGEGPRCRQIGRQLLLLRGRFRPVQKEELGAQQADPLRPLRGGPDSLRRMAHIGIQAEPPPIQMCIRDSTSSVNTEQTYSYAPPSTVPKRKMKPSLRERYW